MVTRDKFGAFALMTPGFYTSDSPGRGALGANVMRSAYSYAQTRGRMVGCQTYIERPFDVGAPNRTVSGTSLQLVARHYARLPPYARTVYYQADYRVYGSEISAKSQVAHQLIVTDEAANSAEGIVVYDEADALPLSWRIDVGTDSQQSDPGDAGVFNIFDTQRSSALCSADMTGLLDMTDTLRIDLYAYATSLSEITATADNSDLTSNTVSAEVPAGHGFVVGQSIWTSGFDIDVPKSSPEELSNVTATVLQWTLNAADDADFGEGTIYSATGYPLPYRPSPGCCWWEI